MGLRQRVKRPTAFSMSSEIYWQAVDREGGSTAFLYDGPGGLDKAADGGSIGGNDENTDHVRGFAAGFGENDRKTTLGGNDGRDDNCTLPYSSADSATPR